MKPLSTCKKRIAALHYPNAGTGVLWRIKEHAFSFFFFCSFYVIFFFPFAGCMSRAGHSPGTLFNELDSLQTGINFVNHLDDTGPLNILDYLYYYNGAGVSAGDVNNDGFTDLYFVSNLGDNKLYINEGARGDFSFEDISQRAGVTGRADWQTGVTMADINGDGWLDIYVCAVSAFKGLKGSNELYINNGVGTDGQVTFTESAAEYGLDFSGFSTQATFFDFDKDSDLDMFLLNHAVHTSRSYEIAANRVIPDSLAGDFLFENEMVRDGQRTERKRFEDVTTKAGILQASMGYGLGVSVADFNNDGWDDIYVGNDFHEDDYYYINKGNGSFAESLKDYFGHVSRFSMGCDAADINHDGDVDLMTLDMYPADETIEKSSAGEDPFDIFLFKLKYGYYYQYSRNCLQVNDGGRGFSEIGNLAGVAATDWSWSTLIADYDNDGHSDIFITNGIVRRPNDLDYVKFISNNAQRWTKDNVRALDQQAIGLMPDGRVHNYFFKGDGNLRFADHSLTSGFTRPTISNGAAYADLDNDGDLDIVTNNINEPAGLFRNESDALYQNAFLRIRLKGDGANSGGIGAKVYLKHNGVTYLQHLMPTRGFMSSSEPVLNFGLGKASHVDTVLVIWPDQRAQLKTGVAVNETIKFDQRHAQDDHGEHHRSLFPRTTPMLEDVTEAYPLEYRHKENMYYDFYREPLIPFQVSTEGPHVTTGDVNGDGLDDFYVGGAYECSGRLFVQNSEGQFSLTGNEAFKADSVFEDVDAAFFDADADNDLDLYVVSGGNEFRSATREISDRLYFNDGKGNFQRKVDALPAMYDNKSCVRPCDFDRDGDLDLFVGGRSVSHQYGYSPDSYLLVNDGNGNFSDQTPNVAAGLRKAGMVTDAQWFDWDNDKDNDLIITGDWMPIRIYENEYNKLEEVKDIHGLEQSNGFWQTLVPGDFDNDGDTDFMVGNIGTNSKLRKNEKQQLNLYIKDIDNNGTIDHVLAYDLNGQWYPAASKDELGKRLPFLNKIFTDYKSFAGKAIGEIFHNGELRDAVVLTVNSFSSIWLENSGAAGFKQHRLPEEAQVSKIFAFNIRDLDADGDLDVILGGNLYGSSVYQGRYDAGHGLLMTNDGKGNFQAVKSSRSGFFVNGEIRDMKSLTTTQGKITLVARSNLPLQIFKSTEPHSKKPKI